MQQNLWSYQRNLWILQLRRKISTRRKKILKKLKRLKKLKKSKRKKIKMSKLRRKGWKRAKECLYISQNNNQAKIMKLRSNYMKDPTLKTDRSSWKTISKPSLQQLMTGMDLSFEKWYTSSLTCWMLIESSYAQVKNSVKSFRRRDSMVECNTTYTKSKPYLLPRCSWNP